MVKGLLIKEKTTDTGRFFLKYMAKTAEKNVCTGKGINAQYAPIAAPPAAERRLRCQILGSCR